MPPLLQFFIRRMLLIPISLLVISMLLYAGTMLSPPETRAMLYFPDTQAHLTDEQVQRMIDNIIEHYHLDEPFLVQYGYWAKSLLTGEWGFSPSLSEDVLPALLQRTPATAELALYSILLFIPLGLVSGVVSGWYERSGIDTTFRFTAFMATSLPPFILALILLAVFYVGLDWFAPGRISPSLSYKLTPEEFNAYTGMFTFDGLLNGRPDVTLDALRHLALPVITLSLFHWATLGRIMRVTMIAQRSKEYITAARARGVSGGRLVWRHAFRNALAPSITSLILSAASLVTGVFVVEIIFIYNGISFIILRAMQGIPDAPAALGFSIYSVIIVLLLMFILDIIQAALDPRVRDEVLGL